MIDVIVTNEKALIKKSPAIYPVLTYYLSYSYSKCKKDVKASRVKKKTVYQWENVTGTYLEDDGSPFYSLPRGIAELLPSNEFNIIHETPITLDIPVELSDNYIRYILPGYTLRDDQIDAVKKSLWYKRGINQLATGAGKSLIICAIIKILIEYNPDVRVLLVLPYDHLIRSFKEYFDKFDISYDKSKGNVTLSSALTMSRRPEECSKYKVAIYDEVQHSQSSSYQKLAENLVSAEITLGFSAKVISDDNIINPNIKNLTPSEAYIIGATGKVITYGNAAKYVKESILATPVLMTLSYKCDDILESELDWNRTVKLGLMDPRRSQLAAQVVNIFVSEGRRVLLLSSTHKQSYDLANAIVEENSKIVVGISHGGNRGYLVSSRGIENSSGSDVTFKFKTKEINILIGTTHLDEGADLPDLDVCILAGAGKSPRRIIQRVGRSLRISKTGKYAYLIDFTDDNSLILHRHYMDRLSIYVKDVGISIDRSYKDLELSQVKEIFERLEGLT